MDSSFNPKYNGYQYPSLYTIRTNNSYIIKAFGITSNDSGGNNIISVGRGLKIIICYI